VVASWDPARPEEGKEQLPDSDCWPTHTGIASAREARELRVVRVVEW
jgi:hypothetical protein